MNFIQKYLLLKEYIKFQEYPILGFFESSFSSNNIIKFIRNFQNEVEKSNFFINKLVFNKTSSMFCAFAKSYLCYAISWAISYALTYISSNYLGVSKLFVPVLSLVLTVPLNFLANKFWAFRWSNHCVITYFSRITFLPRPGAGDLFPHYYWSSAFLLHIHSWLL